jgi:hypothetical protein
MTVGIFGTVQSQWGNIQWGQLPTSVSPSVGIFELAPTVIPMLGLSATGATLLVLSVDSGTAILKLTAKVEATP